MKNYINILKTSKLFLGSSSDEIESMLCCLDAKLKHFKKGEYIFHIGEKLDNLMILVDGKLHIQTDDFWGNRSIINIINTGEMFGESYTSPDCGKVLSDVIAVENSSVIFFDINKVLCICPSACKFHTKMIQNLFFAVAEKNRKLVEKLATVSKRSTRAKLISYLSDEAKKQNSSTFEIPFNRQQLADFLSVDRSAMSNELCKMRDEGMLAFNKNNFSLFDIYS